MLETGANISGLSSEAQLIETVLYLENEPVDIRKITRVTELDDDTVLQALAELRNHYGEGIHGIELSELAGGYCFMPKELHWPQLKKHYGRKIDSRLTRSALETISIIAYSQPITRKEIENIRGVSSDTIIRMLMEREYIRIVGKKDVIGRPYLFGTTRKFLEDFNLGSIADLPKLSDLDRERFDEE